MFPQNDYLSIAKQNEQVFRNVLRDLRQNRAKRPMSDYIPPNLETEASLEDIFKMYSTGNRYGIFTICDFSRPNQNTVLISFKDTAVMSGGGAELEYLVRQDNSVTYHKPLLKFRS